MESITGPVDKDEIRRRALEARDALAPSKRAALSSEVVERLVSLPEYRAARTPLFYVSFRSEVETHGIIRQRLSQGLTVAVPLTRKESRRLIPFVISDFDADLSPGAYGILEPREDLPTVSPAELDLVVVPGSVFDRQCGRFGYGGGYYDRFLSREAPQATRIGLAFECQIHPRLPLARHDEPMDMVVTHQRVYRCAQQ